MTAWLAVSTRKLAKAAKQEAEAVDSEAKATRDLAEESRRDRELQWRPILTMRVTGARDGGGVAVANSG